MTEPTDAELTECYKAANGEDVGKAQPITTQRIFRAMRAAIAKWGTPPVVAGEPNLLRAAAIELRDAPDLRAMQRATAKLYAAIDTTPQPTQAQAGAVPLTVSQIREWWESETGIEDCDMCRITDFLRVVRAVEERHGIKGGQHGADT